MQYQDPWNSYWLVFVNAQQNVYLYINLHILYMEGLFLQQLTNTKK